MLKYNRTVVERKELGVVACDPSQAWDLFYDVMKASKPYLESVGAAFDLTPQQLYALKQLDNERPLPMSALASSLGCDASNVTSLVDRLESRGLVERRSADYDRRVKALVMTNVGVELRDRVTARMKQQPPPWIANLSKSDQETLCTILTRALESL